MKLNENIIELLTIFDEMDFIPINTYDKDPVKYAIEWKKKLIKEIEKL